MRLTNRQRDVLRFIEKYQEEYSWSPYIREIGGAIGVESTVTVYMHLKKLKVYVDVNVRFGKDGNLIPRSFIWEDGTTYEIDKVTKKERCASRKAGGVGIMYTCMVEGKECHLYFEVDKFIMEKKQNC